MLAAFTAPSCSQERAGIRLEPVRNGWGPGARWRRVPTPSTFSAVSRGPFSRLDLPKVGRPTPLFLPGRFAEPVPAPGAIADSMPEVKKAEGPRYLPRKRG